MSLNVVKVKTMEVLDPRLNLRNEREYIVLRGSSVNSFEQFSATNPANSGVTISCNPQSKDIAISRLIFKKFIFDIDITGTNAGSGNLLREGFYGPRAYPLQAVTINESLSWGTVSTETNQGYVMWPAMLWYHNRHNNRFNQGSLTPSMMDQSQQYGGTSDTNRNPLSKYSDQAYEMSRGGFSGMVVSAETKTSAHIKLTIVEPIMVSPAVFGKGSNSTPSVIGIQNMSYNNSLVNLQRLLSLVRNQGLAPPDPGARLITSVTATLTEASLLFEYLTPDSMSRIPRTLVSSYYKLLLIQSTQNAVVPSLGTTSISMNSYQIEAVPRRLYIWAGKPPSDLVAPVAGVGALEGAPFQTDTFFALNEDSNPLQLTFNSNTFFSKATTYDLYNIACKNGIDMSYSQFAKQTGSVLALDFSSDIGLSHNQAPGLGSPYQLSISLNVKNISDHSITPILYVVVVYEGTFTVDNGVAYLNQGILTHEDVLKSKEHRLPAYVDPESIYGGSFFSDVGDFFRSIPSKVKSVLPYVKEGIDVAKDVASLARAVRGGKRKGMTRAQLRKQLMGAGLQDPEDEEDDVQYAQYSKYPGKQIIFGDDPEAEECY